MSLILCLRLLNIFDKVESAYTNLTNNIKPVFYSNYLLNLFLIKMIMIAHYSIRTNIDIPIYQDSCHLINGLEISFDDENAMIQLELPI